MEALPNSLTCDETNFQKLHKDYARKLRNFIYYKCGDLQRSEDLVQEAYIKLWDNCKTIVLEKAKSFLYTVVNRLFLDEVRHEKVVLKFAKDQNSNPKSEDPNFIFRENEFKNELEKAIASLPEQQRETFLMNRIDKMTFQEIAATLDISVKAVESRMHRAIHTLKEQVKELNIYKI